MITCFIRDQIDPFKGAAFQECARKGGQAIPRCSADLVGDAATHEGSSTTACGVYQIESPTAYEAYRARLRHDPRGHENDGFAERKRFIQKEERIVPRPASVPYAPLIRP